MKTIDFKDMDWIEARTYFQEVGLWQTFLISKDQHHPLYISANDYLEEKNE